MKKRILFASKDLSIGGMEKALITLLNNIDYDSYCVTLVLESVSGDLLPLLDKRVRLKEYNVKKDGFPLLRKSINFMKRVLFRLSDGRKYSFSCCYATYSHPCRVVALLASKNNMLYIHNDYLAIYKDDKDSAQSYFDSIHVRDYKTVAFVSAQSRDKMACIFPELDERFMTLGNLVDAEKIKELSSEPMTDIPECGVKTVFVFVGRIAEEQKRITRLIEAAKLLKESQAEFELWIVGGGPDVGKYQNKVSEYGLRQTVKFLGSKTNPYPYMKNADCIVLSSDFEGFPVVYYEAAVFGLNIVTTVPASDGILDISEKTAFIAEKTPESVADAMDKIIKGALPPEKLRFAPNSNNEKLKRLYSIIEQD